MSGDFRLKFARSLLGLGPDEEIPGTFPCWRAKKPCAGRLLGLGREKTYALCQQGTFPVPLLPFHGNGKNDYRVSTFRLLALLGLDGEARDDAPADGFPGLVVQQGSQASDGRRQGQLRAGLLTMLGPEPSEEER